MIAPTKNPARNLHRSQRLRLARGRLQAAGLRDSVRHVQQSVEGRGSRVESFRAGYDAATDSKRRRPHSTQLWHEDEHLNPEQRRKVVGGTRDACRNFVMLGWMVRTYLNFVAGMTPKFKTPDKGLNRELKDWCREASKRENFDVRGVHDRRRFVRLAEARRLLDGDFASLKIGSGHLQAIETDRIRDPGLGDRGVNQKAQWRHGVRTNASGKPLQYAIHKRTGRGRSYTFERIVNADSLIWHSWHESHFRFDACRGVSPITSALNELADFYEGKEFARVKLKVAQMLGLVIYSEGVDGVGEHTETADGSGKYDVDPGRGPFKLELDAGDRADFIDPRTPANETVNFLNFCILVFLKALDLPFSYFREDFTNFFGSKIATVLMLNAARPKRADVRDYKTQWLRWRLSLAVGTGELVLPRGVTVDDVVRQTTWIPDGMPWFDRSREVKPALQAIAGGIESHSRLIAELYGMDFDDWLELLRDDQDEIEAAGVQLVNYDKVVFISDPADSMDNGAAA